MELPPTPRKAEASWAGAGLTSSAAATDGSAPPSSSLLSISLSSSVSATEKASTGAKLFQKMTSCTPHPLAVFGWERSKNATHKSEAQSTEDAVKRKTRYLPFSCTHVCLVSVRDFAL
jgi:hypothetical protein